MQCYRSAIREALERGRGSTGGHEIAQVLEEWAAAPAFVHPDLDGMQAGVLLDRTLEIRHPDALTNDPAAAVRDQYRVIGGQAYHRRMPPDSGNGCWSKEPDWTAYDWDGTHSDLVSAFLNHEGAQDQGAACGKR